jgi:hypothetical protein
MLAWVSEPTRRTDMKMLKTLVVAGALFVPAVAAADEASPYNYSWHESSLKSDIGVSTILGGGVVGYTDQTMRGAMTTNVGGLWDLRLTLGSHTPIGFEAVYTGTAFDINALTGAQTGTVVGNSFEGALRYNILPHYSWNPYAFAGVGWQRYDLTGGTFTTSDSGFSDKDNSVVFPMGLGVAYRSAGLVLDLRGTFRANANSELMLTGPSSTSFASLHTWSAGGAIGYEF